MIHWSSHWYIYLTSVEIIMSLFILVGNGLVIAAYISDRKLRTVTNFFLVNLVIADLTVGIALPISCGIFYIPHQISPYMCTLQFTVIAVPMGSSTLCLLLITVERYRSVVFPFHHQLLFTKKRRYALVLLSWFLAFLVMGVIPMVLTKQKSTTTTLFDLYAYSDGCNLMSLLPAAYWWVMLLMAFILLSSIMVVYMKILSVARYQIKSIELLVLQVSLNDKRNIQNVKLARTGCILIGLFIVCWMPFVLILTIELALNLAPEGDQNKVLRVARIVSMILVPASSAINPMIYPARIRRFRLTIKKLLNLTISHSDKFETYEIRQSFRVKRKSALDLQTYNTVIQAGEAVSSSDSGVDGLHCEDSEDTSHIEKSTSPYTCKIDRSLSRISESPEHRSRGCSVTSDAEIVTSRIKHSDSHSTETETTNHNNNLRRANRPQILNLPITTQSDEQQTQTDNLPSTNTLYDNVSPQSCVPRCEVSASHTAVDGNYLCTEPIVVDCDSKSDYFRLVVRRTVRDCDSDSDDCDEPDLTLTYNSTRRDRKSNSLIRIRGKNKQNYLQNRHSSISLNTCNITDTSSAAQSTTRPAVFTPSISPRIIHHRRAPSNQSTSSLGLTVDNDDIELEVSDTNRKKNNFMQLTYASLQRRKLKHEILTENETQSDARKDKSAVREFWDGTLKRLKGQKRVTKSRSQPLQSKLSRQASRSLTDVSKSAPPKTVHKRSRSDLDQTLTPINITIDHVQSPDVDIPVPDLSDVQVEDKGLLIRASGLVQSLRVPNNGLLTPQYHIAEKPTIAQINTDITEQVRITQTRRRMVNKKISKICITERQTSLSENTDNPDIDCPISAPLKKYGRCFSEQQTSPNYKTASLNRNMAMCAAAGRPGSGTPGSGTPGSNDVVLPVRIRLRGGGEEDMVLTKQDIYSQNYPLKNSRQSNNTLLQKTRHTKRVVRNRSMSQPSISTITKWRSTGYTGNN